MSVPILSGWLAPEAVRASLQRRGVEVSPTKREKMKNFMALKDKIVKTDELIVRYQARARECEQYKGRLASLEQANTGLRAELQALHKENGRLKLSLQTAQRQLMELEEKREVDEVVIKQLTAQVEQLRMQLRMERITESRRDKNEEKDRWMSQYQSLRRQFEAYKQVHAKAALRPARHRRTSDASTSSSLATVSSPGYIPVYQNSPMSSISLPDTMEGRIPLEDLLFGEPGPRKNSGESVVSAAPEDPPSAEQQNEDLNLLPAPSSCNGCDPTVHQDTSVTAAHLSMEANHPPTTDNGEDSSDDALSVSDSSSMCSESSLDDLADYLNSSQETTDTKTSSILPLLPSVLEAEAHDTRKLAAAENSACCPVVLACGSSEVGLQSNRVPHGAGVLFECVLGGAMECKTSHQEEGSTATTAEVSIAVGPHPQVELVPEQNLLSTCHVATDSNTSEENDLEDISFLEIDGFLSPLPFSPHRNLQTLSPLPPTPMPKGSHYISTPLMSPISLRQPMISPLPQTPRRDQDSTQPLLQAPSRDQDSIQHLPALPNPLPQFADNAPMGLHIPKPCVPSSSIPSHHKLTCKQLRLSESSLFSPPFDSTHQPTLGLPGKCPSVPSSRVAFEATNLELHSQFREKMEHSQVKADKENTVKQLRSDSMVMMQEAVITPTQETTMEMSAIGGKCDSQEREAETSNVAIPPSGVDSEISGSTPAVGSTTIVNPVVVMSKDTAVAVGLSVSDSDTEEGEIVDSEGEAEVFENSKEEGEIVDNWDEEEGEIVDGGKQEGEEIFDSGGEGKIVDGGEEVIADDGGEEEGEIVDRGERDGEIVNKSEIVDEGEKVDRGEEEGEIVDGGKKETVDNSGKDDTLDSGGEAESEVVDRREEETVDNGGEEKGEVVGKREIVSNHEEEGEVDDAVRDEEREVVDTVREEDREVVDSEREEERWVIDNRGEQKNTSTGCAGEGSWGTRRWSARLRQGRTENNFSQLMTPANNLWTGRKQPRGPPPSLPQTSRQQTGLGGRRASCEKGEIPPRKKQRMAESPSCQTLEATPENLLPGYQLRSRCVNFWQAFPKRRRRLSTSESKDDSPPLQKMMKMMPPEDAHGPSSPSENNLNPFVRATRNSEENVPVEDVLAAASEGVKMSSEKLPFDSGPAATSVRTRRESEKLPVDSDPASTSVSTRKDSEKLPLGSGLAVRAKRNSEKLQLVGRPATACKRAKKVSVKLPVASDPAATSVGITRDPEKLTLDNGPTTTSWRTRRNSEKLSVDYGRAVGANEKLRLDGHPATTCKKAKKDSVQLPMDTVATATNVSTRRDSEKLPVDTVATATSVSTRRDSEKLPVDTVATATSVSTRRDSEKLPVDNGPASTGVSTRRDSEKLPVDNYQAVTSVRTRRDSEKLPVDNGPAATRVRTRRDSEKLPLASGLAATIVRTRRDSKELPVDNGPASTGVSTRRDSEKLPVDNSPAATRVRTRRDSEKLPVNNCPVATSVRTRRDSEKLPLGSGLAATRRDLEKLTVDNDPASTSVRTRKDSERLLVGDGPATCMLGRRDSEKLPVDNSILVTPMMQASKIEVEARKSPSSVQEPDNILLGTTPWVGVVSSDVGVGSGKHVRQTDGATGQEEDRTPASSPRNKEVGQRCSGSKQAAASQQIIGDLRLPFNSSTPLTSQQTFHLPPQPQPPIMPPRPPPATSTSTSLVQQQLTVCMQCPLPLPLWLVNAMSKVQSCGTHNPAPGQGLKNKKRGNPRDLIFRQKKQMPFHYAVVNLERLMCGHLFLSTAIAMFSDPWNSPSPADLIAATIEYLTQCYNPHFEQVVTLFHQLCDNVRANPQQLDPLDPAFPPALLRQECQFVALFAHVCRTNKNMTHLLPELTKALHQAILAQGMKFHRLAALCRLFTAMCRLQGEPERVLFLCFDLVRKPLGTNEYPVLPGIGSIWPRALSRRLGVKLVERNQVLPHGLEQQPLTYTLEFIVVSMFRKHGEKTHESLLRNMHTLCKWSQVSQPSLVTSLVHALVEVLKASQKVYIDSPPPGQIPWRRPRPSTLAFHIVHCLRLLTWHQGWVWTNDVLIRAYLWPLLQQWNSSADSVREATVVCTMRLIGFIGQLGVAQDPQSSSIAQLQRVLIALLHQSTSKKEVSLPIQLAAADSLLELCPPSHSHAQEAMTAINTWLGTQCRQPAGMVLAQEFNSRLQPYLHVRAL